MTQNLSLAQSFEIKPSQQHEKLFNVLRLVAVLACVLSSLAMAYKLALISTICMFKLLASQHKHHSFYQMRFTEFSGLEMAFENDKYTRVTILGSTVVTAFVIFLHCKMHNESSRTFVIVKDSLSKNEFRRLIVKLTLCGHVQSR